MSESFNLDNKVFTALFNSVHGQVNQETLFHYHQNGKDVWAHYAGGTIRVGMIIGEYVREHELTLRYQHIDTSGVWRSGKCQTTIEVIDDKYRLHELWHWDDDEASGNSVLVEVG